MSEVTSNMVENETKTQAVKREKKKALNVRNMVQIAMLSAIATVLMLFEIPLWFAPSFYEIDLSEVPVLIGAFAMGPAAGAIIELIKILLNFVINGTITGGVGEAANFVLGCMLVVPAAVFYKRKKSKRNALIGMVIGTVLLTIVGCLLNVYVLLPAYAAAFGMPIDTLVGMGAAVNTNITNLFTFAILAVAPFNILKGVVVSIITLIIYKPLSHILHHQ